MASEVILIFGTFFFGGMTDEEVLRFLDVLEGHGVNELDTARIYKNSERALGNTSAPSRFAIGTKLPSFVDGCLGRSSILLGVQKSLAALKTESVDTLYIHTPDKATPIKETMDTIQELWLQGKFRRLGLSNFLAQDIERIHQYASSRNYILPKVYQGNYNPVARHMEKDLLPILRRLGMSFYAYSPLAGGFLVHDSAHIVRGLEGRFDRNGPVGPLYQRLYNKPKLLNILPEWHRLAQDEGCSRAALAYRWVRYHSALSTEDGDGVVLGASSPEQLRRNLLDLGDGPLKSETVERIDDIWAGVEDEGPLDSYHS